MHRCSLESMVHWSEHAVSKLRVNVRTSIKYRPGSIYDGLKVKIVQINGGKY